jgi:hypothetical protein
MSSFHGYNKNIVGDVMVPLLFSRREELFWYKTMRALAKLAFILSFFSINEQFCAYNDHSSLLVSDI